MTRTTIRLASVTALALAASLALSACSTSVTTTTPTATPVMVMMSDNDIMFAQMMIPHHQQAVEMSTLAETHTTNGDVLALARAIKDAQSPEIAQMTSWLTEAGEPLMGHSMGDDGMLSDDEMNALANANGTAFDKLYLTGMIAHHKGAIAMAKSVAKSTNPDVKALSDAIIASQTAEIDKMSTLLLGL